MSAKPKDHRPKIIHFSISLDGLNIAAKKDILWPCHAFSISIPHQKKSELNVFEETVLKLTEIEVGNTDKIAGTACLEKDLVLFIQNRLKHLDLVDNRYSLSAEGKQLLESWSNNSDENIEYVAATIFVDLNEGEFLPYVHAGNLQYQPIKKIKDVSVKFNQGTTGKTDYVWSELITPRKDSYWKKTPSPNDIIKIIRKFKARHKQHALLNSSTDQYPPPLPIAKAISVQEEPELVYLHCKALIQTGNTDLLVTNGCGLGFSKSFAVYLIKQNWEWVTKLKKGGVIQEQEQSKNHSKVSNRSWKYPHVTGSFCGPKGIDGLLGRLDNLIESGYKEKDYIRNSQSIASKLYSALEWTLSCVVSDHPVAKWEEIFKSQSYEENEKLLCQFADKIGLLVPKTNQSILQVKAGAIRQIEHGKVELQPLLAMAIAGAIMKSSHPFHKLVANHAGFLELVSQLKKLRDSVAHGKVDDFKADTETLKGITEKLKEVIITLLPSIASELKQDNTNLSSPKDDVNQERLKADFKLEEALGIAFVYEMADSIKEQLTRVEMMLDQYSDEQSIEVINCLASVMQLALAEVIAEHEPLAQNEGDTKDTAINRIVESGFYSSPDAIPKEISTVRKDRIDKAVQGSGPTLGANLLAIFLLDLKDELTHLKDSDSAFIEFIAKLIKLRGHGNERHNVSQSDLESLKKKVFKAIKIIEEIF